MNRRRQFNPRSPPFAVEQLDLHSRTKLGYFPCYSVGNEIYVVDPEDHDKPVSEARVLQKLVAPRQPKNDRICLADFYRPKELVEADGQYDVVPLQAVTVGSEVTELLSKLEEEGEFSEQLFIHGVGVQTAEAMAEWLHAKVREDLGIDPGQGRRYSWGYPAVPEPQEHEKVVALLKTEEIGLGLSFGFAPYPEQSTMAIVAHHPQAVYYGSTAGFLPKPGDLKPDQLIKGTERDPSVRAELLEEPRDMSVESEVEADAATV